MKAALTVASVNYSMEANIPPWARNPAAVAVLANGSSFANCSHIPALVDSHSQCFASLPCACYTRDITGTACP